MDFTESTRAVFDRIQKLEPEHVSKIIGYILLQDHGEHEMLRLAFGPDNLLQCFISKAKAELGLSPRMAVTNPMASASVSLRPGSDIPLQFTPYTPTSTRSFSSPAAFRVPSPYWEAQLASSHQHIHNLEFVPHACYADPMGDDYHLHGQASFLTLDDQLDPAKSLGHEFSNSYYYPEHTLGSIIGMRNSRRTPSLPEFPVKACHYFNKGYCKHGTNCRYFHGQIIPDGFSQIFNPCSNELGDEHVFSPGSLEKLELELTELLKSRRGIPVSIASLPMLYYEKYGKNLQADGYLTESQRHGKAGYSLTKLLARLKNSIRLIDRPHGQHSVVLAEDASRYMEYRNDRNDPGVIVSGSRQIYLTFPAESTFTEEDVSEYFKIFGPVQDVRIPSQPKRMFGFVTFVYPETVKEILTKGNPHFVCGARVLVKPYREKSRLVDRKYQEKIEASMCYSPHFFETDPQLHLLPRACDSSRLLRKQAIEQEEIDLERRVSELQLTSKQMAQQLTFSHSQMENFRLNEDRFNYLVDILNHGSVGEDKPRSTSNYCDADSQGINLPESPFASPIASGISTVS